MEEKKQEALRMGVVVMIILAVLTAVEYFFGAFASGMWFVLLLIGLVKAFFVIRDYMHLPRLFAEDEEGH